MGSRISDVQQRDRPRERLQRLGTSALTDAELVALVLGSGGAGVSALHVAEDLLAEAGGLSRLAAARVETVAAARSVGTAKSSAIVAAFELGRRAALGSAPQPIVIRDSEDIVTVARRELTDPTRETVLVLVLGSSNRLIKVDRLTIGTETRCLLEPRDVLRTVVGAGGVAFAVAHSHPSGNPTPSAEDVHCTRLLSVAADAVGVLFIDHVVVAPQGWASVSGNELRAAGLP